WDIAKQQLFLARDRLGIKPLYYSVVGSHLRFASNTQALLAAGALDGSVDTSIDAVALHYQLTLHAVVPAPRTLLKGIRKLPPGETLTINAQGEQRFQRYWQLRAERPASAVTPQEWQAQIHDALRRAVRSHMDIADVPVGVLLSGGLDSSLLVALLAEQGAGPILTYSIGFEDQPEERGSEFEFSDQLVERYQTKHHKLIIPNAEVLPRLPEAVANMAEPMVGQDAVAFYLLAEQVAKSVKVVQSGQGADEVFAGYFWYPQMVAAQGSDCERFAQHYFDRSHDEYLQTVTPGYGGADHTSALVASLLAEPGAADYLDKVLRLDVTTLIVDDPVKRVDNMTMAWGLEARVPFLDHQLVELAASMPPEMKLGPHGDESKYVLKQIARGLIPDAIIDRPKGYFPMPALKYVRGDFYALMESLLNSSACRQRDLFNRSYVDKLLAAPDQHFTRLQGSKLWHLALLELWLQQSVDSVAAAARRI
ncbi:MAG: N-acetylglutaminylglutamine amidotransferase, partial [Gammaproteobacteria bacterium]|nr:N-acetylglutaminylglutamine amidotransferase [Gammaproteobacteria bacterium]